MSLIEYNPVLGKTYAQSYALYNNVPENKRLFYYSPDNNCTNFISQCVWAAYGGWLPGFTDNMISRNAERILNDFRQVKGEWYGSAKNIGSNKWCRVEEFYSFVTAKGKKYGPVAQEIAQGTFENMNPILIQTGDVIQMVVSDYAPDRYGHGLYVTMPGPTWEVVRICCNTLDRQDTPMAEFSEHPEIYTKLRVLRFSAAEFAE